MRRSMRKRSAKLRNPMDDPMDRRSDATHTRTWLTIVLPQVDVETRKVHLKKCLECERRAQRGSVERCITTGSGAPEFARFVHSLAWWSIRPLTLAQYSVCARYSLSALHPCSSVPFHQPLSPRWTKANSSPATTKTIWFLVPHGLV